MKISNPHKYYTLDKIFSLKKLIAITLLTLQLFNLGGYSLFFQYFVTQSDYKLVQSLDKNEYNEADLVQVKVPVNLPYYTDQKDYERVDGNIELNGLQYNYVKRKMCNDTLYLLCLPNHDKTCITAVKNSYAKEANDIPSSKKQGESSIKKNTFSTDYNCITLSSLNIPLSPIQRLESRFIFHLPNYFIAIPGHPPECIG